jgi:hypothetical protein
MNHKNNNKTAQFCPKVIIHHPPFIHTYTPSPMLISMINNSSKNCPASMFINHKCFVHTLEAFHKLYHHFTRKHSSVKDLKAKFPGRSKIKPLFQDI